MRPRRSINLSRKPYFMRGETNASSASFLRCAIPSFQQNLTSLFRHFFRLDRFTGLSRGTFFQSRFAAQFDPAFVIDPDAFDPDHFTHLGHVLGSIDSKISQLGDMDQTVFTWKD